jgi:hypothetical protein
MLSRGERQKKQCAPWRLCEVRPGCSRLSADGTLRRYGHRIQMQGQASGRRHLGQSSSVAGAATAISSSRPDTDRSFAGLVFPCHRITWRVVSRSCDRSLPVMFWNLGDELARLFPFAVLAERQLTGDEDATSRHRNDTDAMIALHLCLGGRNHFLCRRQVEHLLFGKLRGRILRREWECRENKSKCIRLLGRADDRGGSPEVGARRRHRFRAILSDL